MPSLPLPKTKSVLRFALAAREVSTAIPIFHNEPEIDTHAGASTFADGKDVRTSTVRFQSKSQRNGWYFRLADACDGSGEEKRRPQGMDVVRIESGVR